MMSCVNKNAAEPRRVTLVVNPNSGTFSKKGLEAAVMQRLLKAGFEATTVFTQGPGDATHIARAAANHGAYAVLACGGDGTVNEVAAGLVGSQTALAIIPAGSGNGLARHMGIPIDAEKALDIFLQDNIEKCDYGTVNGRPFFCTFGVGFDAAVSRRFAEKPKRGIQSYIDSAIEEFMHYNSDCYEISFDNHTLIDKALMVTVCNASQYGNNAFIAPAASIQDGLLDVTVISDGRPIENAWSGVVIMAGTIGNRGRFKTFRTSALRIRRFREGVAHIDGEPTELGTELEIRCHAGALRAFLPRQKQRFIPIITPALLGVREWDAFLRNIFRRH